MPRRTNVIHPETGEITSASEAGALELIERGYELADAPAEPELEDLKRDQLDAMAADLGVEGADKLPNKAAVIDAIKKAEAE